MRRGIATVLIGALYCVAAPQHAAEALPKAPDVRTDSLERARQKADSMFSAVNVVSGPQDGVVQTQDPLPETPVRSRNAVLRVWMQARPKGLLDGILGNLFGGHSGAQQTGKQTVVPQLYGMSRPAALAALRQAHLGAEFPEPVGDSDWGVAQQDPVANVSEPENTVVTVTMGPAVPDLSNDTEEVAASSLSAIGLALGHVTQAPPPGEPRTVLRQAPEAGRFIVPGRTVDIWIPTRVITASATPPVPPVGSMQGSDHGVDHAAITHHPIHDPPPPVRPSSGGLGTTLKWIVIFGLIAAAGFGGYRWFHPGLVVWQETMPPMTAASVSVLKQPKIAMEWRGSAPDGNVEVRQQPALGIEKKEVKR